MIFLFCSSCSPSLNISCIYYLQPDTALHIISINYLTVMHFRITVPILEKTEWIAEWSYNIRQQGSKLTGNNHTFTLHNSTIKLKDRKVTVVTWNLVWQFRNDQILHNHVFASFFEPCKLKGHEHRGYWNRQVRLSGNMEHLGSSE